MENFNDSKVGLGFSGLEEGGRSSNNAFSLIIIDAVLGSLASSKDELLNTGVKEYEYSKKITNKFLFGEFILENLLPRNSLTYTINEF
jgi:hypothetical protein